MFVIRPIQENDLDGLMSLLKESGHGLTSLPKDEKIIKDKITHSVRSFKYRGDKPNGETYLFIMEELFTGKIWSLLFWSMWCILPTPFVYWMFIGALGGERGFREGPDGSR